MARPPSDEPLLLIRCPSCGQRFKVEEELRGRTVECGGCETRFRINDEVIVRWRKFYPGERRNPELDRFHRVPLAPVDPGIPGAGPPSVPDGVFFEPPSPQRVIAGIAAVAIMALIALLLVFGARRGGMLDGMVTQNRLFMAGFTALLGIVLLVYANPKARMKAAVVGFFLGAGLVVLPLVFTEGAQPLPGLESPLEEEIVDEPPTKVPSEPLSEEIGLEPLEKERARLAEADTGKQAVGVWLRNLREHNKPLVKDYIVRMTGASPESHPYPRGRGDFLMVVTGIDRPLAEVAEILGRVGEVRRVLPKLGVVEVAVDNASLVEAPFEKLNNREDPAFYELNKRELESIDLERASRAVKRLAEVEPKMYRSDISRRMLGLLEEDGVTFKGDLARALAVWSDEPGVAGKVALAEASKLVAAGEEVPKELIKLILREKTPGVVPVIDALWSRKPLDWEGLYGEAGPAAEGALLERFPTTEGAVRHSVVRLLGKVGGRQSLPVLEAARNGADPELSVLIENSIQAIRQRQTE